MPGIIPGTIIGSFAIHQTLLGWTTYKYDYETDELPNPRPTQPRKNEVKKWQLGHFFPQQIFLPGLGLVLYRKQTTKTSNQTEFSANTVILLLIIGDRGPFRAARYRRLEAGDLRAVSENKNAFHY